MNPRTLARRARNYGTLLGLAALASCGDGGAAFDPEASGRDKPLVVTTFHPTEYMTGRIAGDAFEVICDVPDYADALFWRPDEILVAKYQTADLIILNGAGLETWLDEVSLPKSKMVDTTASFDSRFLEFETTTTHSHGGGEEHTHEGVDAHTWVDPENARIQAEAILEGLIRVLPKEEEALRGRFGELAEELAALDQGYAELGDLPEGHVLVASHPAYNYLADRHGWAVVNLDLDPEGMPADEDFEEVAAQLEGKTARALLWESEPLPEIAERFREDLGLVSFTVSPAELIGAEEAAAGVDFMTLQTDNLSAVRAAFALSN